MTEEQKAIAIVMQKNKNGRMTRYITQDGFYIILDMLDSNEIPYTMPPNDRIADFSSGLINTLQEQLKAKDGQIRVLGEQLRSKNEQIQVLNEQLKSKDIVINSLLEQNKNFQFLLKGQQVLSLPEKKRPFFKRLFFRNENE